MRRFADPDTCKSIEAAIAVLNDRVSGITLDVRAQLAADGLAGTLRDIATPRVVCVVSRPHCNTCGIEARPDEAFAVDGEEHTYDLPMWRDTPLPSLEGSAATLLQCSKCQTDGVFPSVPSVESIQCRMPDPNIDFETLLRVRAALEQKK